MIWLLIAAWFVVVLVGMWLYAGWRERNKSQVEAEMAKLREATQEMAEELGKALRPPLQKIAEAMAEAAKAFKR